MNAEDFKKHQYRLFDITDLPRIAEYQQRCAFKVYDYDEYVLFLTFFLEAMTAASFSLFDVCGHLLKEMYDLKLPRSEVTSSGKNRRVEISYVNVTNDLGTRAPAISPFLRQYLPDDPNMVSWIKPLKKIRNATTHQRITDICFHFEKTNLYFPAGVQEFRINQDFFDPPKEEVLNTFVEECFNGLKFFVTELYDRLRQSLETDKTIPLY